MEYIYSALLLHKAGKQISEDAVKKVLESAGVKIDDARIKALVASLEGVDIEKAIETQAAMQVVASAQASGDGHAKKDDKKEPAKKPEEEKKQEEAAAAGLSALFG